MALFPRLRVGAYVICADDDDRILLSRWIGFDGCPQWSLAGGGLDPGEHPQQGALRELFEETGYTGELDALVGVDVERFVSDRQVPDGYDGVDFHAVRIVYRGHVTGGELTHEVGGTSDRAEWVPRDKLSSLDAVPLVATGIGMVDDGAGVGVPPRQPHPLIPAGVTVEQRIVAYGRTPDGDTVGGLLDHGADPAEAIRAAFEDTRNLDVDVLCACDATGSVEFSPGGTARWIVRLEYSVA